MTRNCPMEKKSLVPVSPFFSSVKMLIPGLSVSLLHPGIVPAACITALDLAELEGILYDEQRRPSVVSLLSDDEKELFAAYTYPKRQKEWLGGRLACKASVLELLAQPISSEQFDSIVILPSAKGRPLLTVPSSLPGKTPAISISHSGRYAVAISALAGSCGIDIQQLTPTISRVVDRFADPGEVQLLRDTIPDMSDTQRLTLLWSAKEALKKSLLPEQPIIFQGVHLQDIRRNHDLVLLLSSPINTNQPAAITATLLPEHILAYTVAQNRHA